MQLTKDDILNLARAMQDWEIAKNKDKSADLRDERILRISTQPKYAIIKNWNKLKGDAEAMEQTINDKFREMGGLMTERGGVWLDPEKVDSLATKHKKNREKLKAELKILKDAAENSSKEFDEWRKSFGAEQANKGGYSGLLGIKPTEDDMDLIPESVWSWYDDHLLMTVPEFSGDHEDKKSKEDK